MCVKEEEKSKSTWIYINEYCGFTDVHDSLFQ